MSGFDFRGVARAKTDHGGNSGTGQATVAMRALEAMDAPQSM